jgi:hypothetical protein
MSGERKHAHDLVQLVTQVRWFHAKRFATRARLKNADELDLLMKVLEANNGLFANASPNEAFVRSDRSENPFLILFALAFGHRRCWN